MKVFESMPEFISSDVRVKRPIDVSYRIDAEFMEKRHEAMLPPELIKGKRILDLGCAVGATGAWCLANGASGYRGVEVQEEMAQAAIDNLYRYFPDQAWDICMLPIEKYLTAMSIHDHWDIIVMSGVIYGMIDYFGVIKNLSQIATTCIVIESMHPWKLIDNDGNLSEMELWERMINFPIVQYTQKIRHSHQDGTKSYEYDGARISIGAFDQMFQHLGWKVSLDANDQLSKTIPDVYNVKHVVNSDPNNPGDAHLVSTASGPRFVIQVFPGDKTKFDFKSTLEKSEDDISFKEWT